MTVDSLTTLLGWSTIINYVILVIWFLFFSVAHDFIYNLHGRWFNMRLETFDAIHYAGMAAYKIAVLVFNLTPWLVLTCLA